MEYHRSRAIRGLAAVALAALAVVASGAVSAAGAPGDPERLFGRACLSTSVTKAGEPRDIVEGTRLRVGFDHERNDDVVRWRAGCNHFGAAVEVGSSRLDIGRVDQTVNSPPTSAELCTFCWKRQSCGRVELAFWWGGRGEASGVT